MKPILMNTEMVKAILDGCKTVTRRLIKQAGSDWDLEELGNGPSEIRIRKDGEMYPHTVPGLYATFADAFGYPMIKAPYQTDDVLYVRETWGFDNHNWLYKADFSTEDLNELKHLLRWRPSIHMPKKAARIFLRVTDVRVELLRNMTEADAAAEGVTAVVCDPNCQNWCDDCMERGYYKTHMDMFAKVWNSTIKKSDLDRYGWDANPWVWVIEFERISREEANK